MNMTFLEIVLNWFFSAGMGLVSALVIIGIPATVSFFLSKSRKEKELLKIQQDRLASKV